MITIQTNTPVYWCVSGFALLFELQKNWKNKTEKSIEAFSTLLTSVLSFIVMELIQMIASNTFLNWLQRKDSEVRSLASRKAGNSEHKSYGRVFHLTNWVLLGAAYAWVCLVKTANAASGKRHHTLGENQC